jgi:predicted  nucleic acid-binding Zn-ribbon protein
VEQDIVAEIRRLLEELVVPELRLLATKLDGLQLQMEPSRKAIQDQLDAVQSEMTAMRGEMKDFRSEMDAFRAEFRNQNGPRLDERSAESEGNAGSDGHAILPDGKKYRIN